MLGEGGQGPRDSDGGTSLLGVMLGVQGGGQGETGPRDSDAGTLTLHHQP